MKAAKDLITELDHLRDQIENLKQAIVERVVPSFASVRDEAQALFEKTLEQTSDEEEADFAAQEHLDLTQSSQQAILDGMAVVLYHLFETSMLAIGRHYVTIDRGPREPPSLNLVMDGLAGENIRCRSSLPGGVSGSCNSLLTP